jgi:hypothetical protein
MFATVVRTLRLVVLLAEKGNGDLLSLAIRYGGIALVTWMAT